MYKTFHASILDSMREIIFAIDLNQQIKTVNQAAINLTGHKRKNLVGSDFSRLFFKKDYPLLDEILTKGPTDIHLKTKEGKKIPISLTSSIIYDDNMNNLGMLFTAKDLTEYRRLEKEILEISEREQKRVGLDLHDGLGQYLTGISYMCQALKQKLINETSVEISYITEIEDLLNHSIAQTRNLAKGLYPVELEKNGLQDALKEIAATTSQMYKINCEFNSNIKNCNKKCENNFDITKNIYFIVKEAVNNAVKHGKAKSILIDFHCEKQKIKLIIADDGKGLSKNWDKKKGMGTQIMSYRANYVGLNFKIESKNEGVNGVRITCS